MGTLSQPLLRAVQGPDVLKAKKNGEVVVVLDGQFIEVWGLDAMEAALKIRTSELP